MRRNASALVLAALAFVALTACGDDDSPAIDAGDTTSTTAPATSSSTASTAPAVEEGTVIEVEVVGGQPVGGSRSVDVPLEDDVTIRVTSDAPDEIHVHGYDVTVDVGPDAPAELTFVAEIPGQFEVELHDSGALLVELVVR